MKPVKKPLTVDEMVAADEHMKTVLHAAQGVLGSITTFVHNGALHSLSQEETKEAFWKSENAIAKAADVCSKAWNEAHSAMLRRVRATDAQQAKKDAKP